MQAEQAAQSQPDGPVAQFRMRSDPVSVRLGLQEALSSEPISRLTEDDRGTVQIVLAEVLNNVVEHAYATASGSIVVSVSLNDGTLNCRVEDEGIAMPGGQPPDGLPPDPAELPEGGFGWHLIRTLCHNLCYEQIDGINRLSFSLPAEQSAN